MRVLFAGAVLLVTTGCDPASVQETANTLDALVPKLVPDEFPATINGTSYESAPITVSAVFVPGAWANNEDPPDRALAWSRFAPDEDGWPGRQITAVSQCEPAGGDYPANAERCSATITANRSATYYLRWRYAAAPPSTDPGLAEPAEPATVTVVLPPPPPPPPPPKNAEFAGFEVLPDPICAETGGTTAQVTYAFDRNDTEIIGANRYCVSLQINGNTYGGGSDDCWDSGDDDKPTSGSLFVELNDHFGGFDNLPSQAEFTVYLHQQFTSYQNSLDSRTINRTVGLCSG